MRVILCLSKSHTFSESFYAFWACARLHKYWIIHWFWSARWTCAPHLQENTETIASRHSIPTKNKNWTRSAHKAFARFRISLAILGPRKNITHTWYFRYFAALDLSHISPPVELMPSAPSGFATSAITYTLITLHVPQEIPLLLQYPIQSVEVRKAKSR